MYIKGSVEKDIISNDYRNFKNKERSNSINPNRRRTSIIKQNSEVSFDYNKLNDNDKQKFIKHTKEVKFTPIGQHIWD